MRALTMDELEYVGGGISLDMRHVPGVDEIGDDDYFQAFNKLYEGYFGAEGSGNEIITITADRIKVNLVSSGMMSMHACETGSHVLTGAAVTGVSIGFYAAFGAEAAAGLALEGPTGSLSTVLVADAVAKFISYNRTKAVLGGLAAGSEFAIQSALKNFLCN